jgi:hypothetical protein
LNIIGTCFVSRRMVLTTNSKIVIWTANMAATAEA